MATVRLLSEHVPAATASIPRHGAEVLHQQMQPQYFEQAGRSYMRIMFDGRPVYVNRGPIAPIDPPQRPRLSNPLYVPNEYGFDYASGTYRAYRRPPTPFAHDLHEEDEDDTEDDEPVASQEFRMPLGVSCPKGLAECSGNRPPHHRPHYAKSEMYRAYKRPPTPFPRHRFEESADDNDSGNDNDKNADGDDGDDDDDDDDDETLKGNDSGGDDEIGEAIDGSNDNDNNEAPKSNNSHTSDELEETTNGTDEGDFEGLLCAIDDLTYREWGLLMNRRLMSV